MFKNNKTFNEIWYSPEMIDFKYIFVYIKDQGVSFLKWLKLVK